VRRGAAHAAVPDLTPLPYNASVKTHSASPGRAVAFLVLVTVASALLGGSLGCEQADEITTYETPRTEPRVTAVDPNEVRAILDHMFAAVVPADGKAWFFKLVVPGANAEAMREPFDKFLATVDVSKSSDGHPTWSLPAGWTEQAGGSAMRAATILVPHEDKKFEITVSSLPLNGDWNDYLKVNVDRWMGQLQQPPLTAATIEKLAHKVPTAHGDATRLELVGTMKKDPMGAGLAGMPAGHPPISERTPEEPAEAAANPSAEKQPDGPVIDEKLTFNAPASWDAQPLGGGMFPREASFNIESDGGKANLGVTKFPASGGMADLGSNVTRWAAEVGITNLKEADLAKVARKISLDGDPALQLEFLSPAGVRPPIGTLVAMTQRGNQMWFFKLFGDKATVETQRDAFDAFLKSVRFDEAD
jgi:hypothetical protein